MKRIYMWMAIAIMCSLTGCAGDAKHCSAEQAETIAEDLLDEEVTYVTSYEYPDEKKMVYIFQDEREHDFAITSELRQGNLDGASFGRHHCYVTDNYAGAMVTSYKEEIIAILEAYELENYLSNTRCLEMDIIQGESVLLPIYLTVTLEGEPNLHTEENRDIMERVAAAGAEIDQLLAITHNEKYRETFVDGDITYEATTSLGGIQLNYEWEAVGMNDEAYTKRNIASFEWSSSEDERWTKEELAAYMEGQLEELWENK